MLRCAAGGTIGEVAAELGVSRDTVSKWRSRFVRDRLERLSDEPRPGRPRVISDEQVDQVITATLEQAPPGGNTHWSTRSMARLAGLSQSAVSRIWPAFGLKPHVVQTWKLSADPTPARMTYDYVRNGTTSLFAELEADIRKWINEWNKNPKPFVWVKPADEILGTLAAYCRLINDSAH